MTEGDWLYTHEIDRLKNELGEALVRENNLIAEIAKLRAALLPYAERAIESEDGGKIALAAILMSGPQAQLDRIGPQ